MLRNACVHADGSGGSSAAFAGAAAPLGDGAVAPLGNGAAVPLGNGAAVPLGNGAAVPLGDGAAGPEGTGAAAGGGATCAADGAAASTAHKATVPRLRPRSTELAAVRARRAGGLFVMADGLAGRAASRIESIRPPRSSYTAHGARK